MVRTLTLAPSFQQNYSATSSAGFRLSVAVSSASGLDPHIFMYLAYPPAPGSADRTAKFQCICSPGDLTAQPASEPNPNSDPAWFRLSTFALDCRTRAEALETWGDIQADAGRLLRALADGDTLAALAPVTLTAGS